MKALLAHPWLVRIACMALGGTLVYASWHKIDDPVDFSKIIYNYRLFPEWSIHALAVFVPWLEAAAGVALFTGLGRRGGAFLSLLFFASFIAFLSINLVRECPTICGCFGTHADGSSLTDDEKFWKMKTELALDVGLVIASLYCLWGSMRLAKSRAAPPAQS